MSGYYYPPNTTSPQEQDFDSSHMYPSRTTQPQQPFTIFAPQPILPFMPQQYFYEDQTQFYQPPHHPHTQSFQYDVPQQSWTQPTVPSNYPPPQQATTTFPQYMQLPPESQEGPQSIIARPSNLPTGYLSPAEAGKARISRSTSLASNASSARSPSPLDISRSVSPNANEMGKWGFRNEDGSWSCAYPGCSSRSTFNRGCDLRKHYKRHTKSLFCRHEGCPQATEGGFSSKKDRARHEAKHNPGIVCEWEDCERLFSRQDNMKDHVRRVHKRRMA